MTDRFWTLYGTHKADDLNNVMNIYATRLQVKMCGVTEDNIYEYSFKEDPDGKYLGWLKTGHNQVTNVCLVKLFNIQFPYGADKLVERGQGEIVHLTPYLVK